MAKIMYKDEVISELSLGSKNATRRFWQKVRAYQRKFRGRFSGVEDPKNYWIFNEEDTRTPGSEDLWVSSKSWTYGGHGPGDFDNRGGAFVVEIEGKRVGEREIPPTFLGGCEPDASKWAHNYGTKLPSFEEEERVKNDVANSPMFYQAFLRGVVLPI